MENENLIQALAELDNNPVTQHEVEIVTEYLRPKISDDDVAACNRYLTKEHRGKIALVDLAAMLVLHCKSVKQNNGASPHTRFIRWSKSSRNTFCGKWDSIHVKVGLIALVSAKTTRKVGEPERRKATNYEVHKELLQMLFFEPKNDSHT